MNTTYLNYTSQLALHKAHTRHSATGSFLYPLQYPQFLYNTPRIPVPIKPLITNKGVEYCF